MQKWHFIWDPPLPGEQNMKKDLELLEKAISGDIPPVFRVYSWAPPALSLGYNQVPETIADRKACRCLGIDVVKRPTGGRAVLHMDEITYSIVIREGYPGLPKGVLEAYHVISRGLAEGLKLLGIEAELAPGEETGAGTAPGSCFDTSAAFEVQVKGKKVIGSAQLRRSGVLLQHGSILLALPSHLYQKLLKGQPGPEQNLRGRAAGLYELGYRFTEKQLIEALKAGMHYALGAVFESEKKAERI